jgi:hypothetical protein
MLRPGLRAGLTARLRLRPRTFRGGSKSAEVELDTWDGAVRAAAVGGRETPPFVDMSLSIAITFRIARPAGHWARAGTPVDSSRPRRR